MANTTPIKYVSLNNGTSTWKIQTNKSSTTGAKGNVFIVGVRGLFEPGESSDSSTPRAYSDGSVINPNMTVSGKNVELDIYIGGVNIAAAKILYAEMMTFFKKKNFTLNTDWVGPYNVQYSNFSLEEGGAGQNGYFAGSLTLITREAW